MIELYCEKCKDFTEHKLVRRFKSQNIEWYSCVDCNSIQEVKR